MNDGEMSQEDLDKAADKRQLDYELRIERAADYATNWE